MLATSASTLAGLLAVAVVQRLPLWHPVVLAYLLPVALVLGGFMALLTTLSAAALAQLSSLLGNLTLFSLVVMFVLVGAWRKVPVYEAFVEGAREGFDVAKGLLPYLVAMLCAVGCCAPGGPGVRAGGNPLVRGSDWHGHAVCGCPAHRAGQTLFRQRGAGHADRNHANAGRGQLCGAGSRHHPGQHRDHVLRWRCTLARWAYSVRATRWAAPCWQNWRAWWPPLRCATSSLGDGISRKTAASAI